MTTIQTADPIYTATLYVEHCPKCGIPFGMPTQFQQACRRDRTSFYCPNGHGQAYVRSIEDDLRREIETRKADLEKARTDIAYWRTRKAETDRSLIATKGHLTRAKNRAAAGVCQDCHRTFQDMARHVHTKHGPTHDQSACAICKPEPQAAGAGGGA